MTLALHTIICSTRPGRLGPAVARWFDGFAAAHGRFTSTLVDLVDFELPVYDEPNHPRLQKYEKPHTRAWSASVAAADAYVFVTPEYNFGPPPPFVNALNYVYREWNYKPCGFVSYGGVSGGRRAVQQEKLLVTALKMMPMMEQVAVVNVKQSIEGDRFQSSEPIDVSAKEMLDELFQWAQALKAMRG